MGLISTELCPMVKFSVSNVGSSDSIATESVSHN